MTQNTAVESVVAQPAVHVATSSNATVAPGTVIKVRDEEWLVTGVSDRDSSKDYQLSPVRNIVDPTNLQPRFLLADAALTT